MTSDVFLFYRTLLLYLHNLLNLKYSSANFPIFLLVRLVEGFKKYGAKALKVAVGEDHTIILTTDGETMGCGVGESG